MDDKEESAHLRDLHAGLAMVGLLMTNRELSPKGMARAAYGMADAMQEARETFLNNLRNQNEIK